MVLFSCVSRLLWIPEVVFFGWKHSSKPFKNRNLNAKLLFALHKNKSLYQNRLKAIYRKRFWSSLFARASMLSGHNRFKAKNLSFVFFCIRLTLLSNLLQLGWRPLMDSYMATLPETLTKEQKELVRELFEWLMQPCLGNYIPILSYCTTL